MDEFKKKFDAASQWSINDWISFLEKGGGKDFNVAWIKTLPDTSCASEQFKDIQEVMLMILELQDNVLSPEGFTEYIYHVGNVSEMNSVIRNGLIPGGKSQKRKTICVLHYGKSDGRW